MRTLTLEIFNKRQSFDTRHSFLPFQTLISIIYILTGEAIAILEYLGFLATLNLTLIICCLLYLRWKQPNIGRPIKVCIYSFLAFIIKYIKICIIISRI